MTMLETLLMANSTRAVAAVLTDRKKKKRKKEKRISRVRAQDEKFRKMTQEEVSAKSKQIADGV